MSQGEDINPSTAFGVVFADELARCGLREVVVAPGSRSTPLALAFHELDRAGRVRLHVRIDERSAAFTALGLARASGRPVAAVCTSGTAAANFHPAVVEADESAVPLLVLTADRPPELRGAGASQTIDQVKLYGSAVRWYADPGVPERRRGAVGHWRSLACQAWARASGAAGSLSGPVHLNIPFRDPLVPSAAPVTAGDSATGTDPQHGQDNSKKPDSAEGEARRSYGLTAAGSGRSAWPEPLAGRAGGGPWTRFGGAAATAAGTAAARAGGGAEPMSLPWSERGLVICGDGDYDATALVELAERAGWPMLAEPSSGARRGPNALTGYQYLLASGEFMAALRPEVIVSAGRPGLSRPQTALLGLAGSASARSGPAARPVRHVVVAQGPGRWSDPQRAATDVVAAVRLTGVPAAVPVGWLDAWRRADEAAVRAAYEVLRGRPGRPAAAHPGSGAASGTPAAGPVAPEAGLTEPETARELLAALPEGALLWCGNSLSIRDIDLLMPPRADVRVIAARGASGIDGTFSIAAGAALAHAADQPGAAAFALIGDLSLLHDAPGLVIGAGEPRPDLCVVVVNNDGGGIFAGLEPAAFPGPFERVFATPHGVRVERLAAAFGIPYTLAECPGDVAKAVAATVAGGGPRIVEVRTDRGANADLRARMRAAAVRAAAPLPVAGQ